MYLILNYFESLIFVCCVSHLVVLHYHFMIYFQNNAGKWSVDFFFTKIYFDYYFIYLFICLFVCLFIYLFIYLFLLCWIFVSVRGLSPVAASGGHSSSLCAGLSLSRPLLLRSTGSRRAGSVIVAQGPSCSAACGIFRDQGSNPCPLHWQADSQPLRHQGSPYFDYFWSNENICIFVSLAGNTFFHYFIFSWLSLNLTLCLLKFKVK